MTDFKTLAHQVCDIARRAGAEIMRIYEETDFGVEHKADQSPLTRADRAANELIVRELAALDFQAPIVSEESREVPFSERAQYTRFWLVDPLDGTKEFIKRNGEFTVNIALIDAESPLLGVVYVPATDDLYWAVLRQGAYHLGNTGQETRLTAAEVDTKAKGLKIVASRSHLNEATLEFINRFTEPELVNRGSALKIVLLAAGEAHVYPRLAPTMEWDTAAAQIVLEEAGGALLDHETGQALRYNKPDLRNPFFVAYGRKL